MKKTVLLFCMIKPILKEIITIKDGIPFSKELDLRESDVFFLTAIKL
ncbi:hypothetical protein [Foetidibacter luteolus]|nr:hypothetical protein [Foetidibacter luteolus]